MYKIVSARLCHVFGYVNEAYAIETYGTESYGYETYGGVCLVSTKIFDLVL